MFLSKLVLYSFLKNWNWAYLWINSVKLYTVIQFVLFYFQVEDCQVPGVTEKLDQNEIAISFCFINRYYIYEFTSDFNAL